jgi:hypothetical protein
VLCELYKNSLVKRRKDINVKGDLQHIQSKHLKTAPALTGNLPGLKNVSGSKNIQNGKKCKLTLDERKQKI